MDQERLFDFGHLFKLSLYQDEGVAGFVLKQLNELDDVFKVTLKDLTRIEQTNELTRPGKIAAYKKLGADTAALLKPFERTVSAYGDRIRDAREKIQPKPHDPNDIGWRLDLREIRDYVRSLDAVECEQFVLQAVEQGDQRTLEAVRFSPVPFTFVTQQLIDRIDAARTAKQFPEECQQIREMERAQGEVQSALASVRAEMGRRGLNPGGDALTGAVAA